MTTVFHKPPQTSRKAVNRAGKSLVNSQAGSKEYEKALEIANQWRLAHLYPINTFQARLRLMIRNMPGAIVAQRLKRMPTIIDKLDRHSNMQLSTMQDIGGVRAIVPNVKSVRNLVKKYESSPRFAHILKDKDDYISQPKEDGYRGIHLVYRYNNTMARSETAKACKGLLVEVQLRTMEQHYWSTAVETMSVILQQPFKTRGGNKNWAEFFALMSSAIAIVEKEAVLDTHKDMSPMQIYSALAEKEKGLRALDLMTGYNFATHLIGSKYHGYYNVIELDMSAKAVTVRTYKKSQYKQAVQEYSDLEQATRGDVTKDIVMVSAGELNTLKKAYPNYFLDVGKFAERLSAIIEFVKKKR